MKVVIDTSVLISYALQNSKAVEIFSNIESKEYLMFVSPDILFEYKNVLRLKKFKFTQERQKAILDKVDQLSIKVNPDKEIKFSRDKFDSPFLSISEHIQADILFTQDKTLQKAGHLIKTKIEGI